MWDQKITCVTPLTQLNQQGDDHLVLVAPTHAKLFKRYQAFFAHPKTKLDNKDNGSMVMVLSSVKQPSSFSVSAKSSIKQKSLTNIVGLLPSKAQDNESVDLFSSL